MEEDDKESGHSNESTSRPEWVTPVLIACGNMMNVMLDDGSAGDATGMGSDSS
jgi:hypothetical protein